MLQAHPGADCYFIRPGIRALVRRASFVSKREFIRQPHGNGCPLASELLRGSNRTISGESTILMTGIALLALVNPFNASVFPVRSSFSTLAWSGFDG